MNFNTNKNIPSYATTDNSASKKIKVGRQIDEEAHSAFLTVANYLENHIDEQKSINELIEMMDEILQDSNSDAYSFIHTKDKLTEYFKGNISFTNQNGKLNVVSHKEKVSKVMHQSYITATKAGYSLDESDVTFERTPDSSNEVELVSKVAKMMKDDIKNLESDMSNFLDIQDLSLSESLNFLPRSLKVFLDTIITSKDADLKKAVIGQALIQACRPKGNRLSTADLLHIVSYC